MEELQVAADIDDDLKLTIEEIEKNIEDLLYNTLVLGHSASFGLKWQTGSTEFFDYVLGSWLYKNSGSAGKKGKKDVVLFYSVDDSEKCLVESKNPEMEIPEFMGNSASFSAVGKFKGNENNGSRIKFSDMQYIHVKVVNEPSYAVRFVVEHANGELTLSPVQDNDAEVVINWVALLRHRARLFDDSLLLAHSKAVKAAVFAQSHYRRKKAYKKYLRRKKRREGVVNVLKSTVQAWWYGKGDGYMDSSDSDDDPEEFDHKTRVKKSGADNTTNDVVNQGNDGNFGFISVVSAVMSEFYNRNSISGVGGNGKDNNGRRDSNVTMSTIGLMSSVNKKSLSKAGTLQRKYEVRPAETDEVEDEVFEMQAWEINLKNPSASKWGTSMYCDRLVREKSKLLDDAIKYDTKAWVVTTDFQLDLSGLNKRMCGKDGWMYGTSVRQLVLDMCLGKIKTKPGVGTVYRRRRWFQRRKRINSSPASGNKVVWHGYLGKTSDTTGRWDCFYFALTQGLQREGRTTGIALIQFKHKITDTLKYVHSVDMSEWEELITGKHFRMYNLEAAKIYSQDSPKIKSDFGFTLDLAGLKKRTLQLSAGSEQEKENWVKWLEYLVKQQDKNFTLTRIQVENGTLKTRKAGEFADIPPLTWSVLDRLVPCSVDEFVHLAYFDTKFEATLHKKLQTRNYEVVKSWTLGLQNGSRKEIKYILPKQRSRIENASTIPRTTVREKFKVEEYKPNKGMHLMSSLEFLDVPFGEVFRCLVRSVVSEWRDSRARLCVSMELDFRSEDENVRAYLESLMRAYMLQYYVDTWMPLCGKAMKYSLENKRKEDAAMALVTPHGNQFKKM